MISNAQAPSPAQNANLSVLSAPQATCFTVNTPASTICPHRLLIFSMDRDTLGANCKKESTMRSVSNMRTARVEAYGTVVGAFRLAGSSMVKSECSHKSYCESGPIQQAIYKLSCHY